MTKTTIKACEVCGEPNAQGHHFEPWQNELRRVGYTGGFLLGELIEACGKPFRELKRHTEYWSASTARQAGGLWRKGSTPREAVARLWLTLYSMETKLTTYD